MAGARGELPRARRLRHHDRTGLGQPFGPDRRRQVLRLRAPASLARRGVLPRVRQCHGVDSSSRRNTRTKGVAMGIQRRNSDRAGRAPLWSPGRPGWGFVRSDDGSGRRSRRAGPARWQQPRWACHRRWGHDGSRKQAGCHQQFLHHPQSRSWGSIRRLPSQRSLRSCVPRAAACARPPAA